MVQHRRAGLAVAAGLIAGVAGGAPATAATGTGMRIGPHQAFRATVKGATGAQGRVEIFMACFGPIKPGQTGHPDPGQTVGVHFVPVPSTTSRLGYTGNRGTSIGAFFGAPPPGAGPSRSSYVSFTYYGTKNIPTSMELPCSGDGQVTFVALPLDPSERSTSVPVTFVPQP